MYSKHNVTRKQADVNRCPNVQQDRLQIKINQRDKGPVLLIKGTIIQEYIIIHVPNSGTANFIKSILDLKIQINSNSIIVVDFYKSFFFLDRQVT